VQARWGDDVPTIPAYVEAGAERFDAILEMGPRVREEVLAPAAAGELLHCLRQGLVATFELAEALVPAFIAILIEHDELGDRSRGYGNIRLWPHRPPATYCRRVGRGVLQPVLGAGMFADAAAVTPAGTTGGGGRVAREDRPATGRAA